MIRKMVQEDIPEIAKIYVDSWRRVYRGIIDDNYLDSLTYEEAEQKWYTFIQHPHQPFIYIAAHHNSSIVGFAAGLQTRDIGELYAIYLAEDSRGLGIGKQLFATVKTHFKEAGIHSMCLWVLNQNEQAIRFYKAMGGVEIDRRNNQFGNTEVEDILFYWDSL